MSIYTVEVRDQFGRLVTTLTRPLQKQFTLYRNKPGSCQFTLDLLDPECNADNLQLNLYDIVFKRDNTPVFAGQISYLEPSIDGDTKQINVIATGYFDLFDQRYITGSYPGYDALHSNLPFASTDAGQVIWDLMNWSQFPLIDTSSEGSQYLIQGATPTINQSFIAQGDANLKAIKLLLDPDFNPDGSPIGNNTDTNQSNQVYGGTGNSGETNQQRGQSFVADGNLVYRVDLKTFTVGSPIDNFIISITSSLGGAVLGSASVPAAILSSGAMNTFTFDAPVSTNSGDTYYLQFSRDGARDTSNYIEPYFAFNTNPYPAGRIYTESNAVWTQDSSTTSAYRFLVYSYSMSGNLVVGLYTDNSGTPGTLIANSQKQVAVADIISSLNINQGWYEIDYTTPAVPLTAGTTYWIKTFLDTTQTDSQGINWVYYTVVDSGVSVFPYGRAYSPEDPGLFVATDALGFFVQEDDNSYQMTKNTYFGIQEGTINTSFNITPVFAQYKKIKSCVETIATTNNGNPGPDFNITFTIDSNNNMTKYINVFYPRQGIDNTSLPFIYPGNIKKISRTKDGKAMVNEVVVRGQGTGLAQPIATELDPVSIQTFSQRQDSDDESDISDTTTLSYLGQEYIRVRKDPIDLPVIVLDGQVAPSYGSYGIGDIINVQITGIPIMPSIITYRIEQIDVTISEDDQEEISLTLSLA